MENKNVTVIDQQMAPVQPHMRLIEMVIEKGGDIVQLEKLMDLQERYEANQAKKDFNLAMSEFQSLLPVIENHGVVDYTSSKGRTYYTYAKVEDIAAAIKPALKASGLSYRFTQEQQAEVITVTCIVTHRSGHSETSKLTSGRDTSGGKDALKGIASTLSYLYRYLLKGSLGIITGGEDVEGENHISIEKPLDGTEAPKECYPDAEFKKNFPKWKQVITSGKKTAQQMLEFLQKKDIVISQQQFEALQQVEVK
jgi:hypothetical protein